MKNLDENRIVRDIKDGIIAIGEDGTILQINPAASHILGITKDLSGSKYRELMMSDNNSKNDEFHQLIIDSISEPELLHRKSVHYTREDGSTILIEVTSSALQDSNVNRISGVVLTFSDRSLELRYKRKIKDSAVLFTALLVALCVWNFVYALWEYFGEPIPGDVLSKIMTVGLFAVCIIGRNRYHFYLREVGLSIKSGKKAILMDIIIAVILVGLLVVAKVIIMKLVPGYFDPSEPFIRWNVYPISEYFIYSVTALLQEIIARGFIHQSMKGILPEQHVNITSILVSSILFGAFHIHLGLTYMVFAVIFLSSMGLIYNRQHNIWGLTIIHYVLGMTIGLLGYVAY